MIRGTSAIFMIAMTVAFAGSVQAQEQDVRFVFQPYIMLPAMDGKAAVHGIDADVKIGREDIINNLNIGFLGYVEIAKGDWAIGVDTNYMNLDATKDDQRTSAYMAQTAVQPMIFYRVDENLELVGGARYNALKVDLESQILAIDGAERKKDWVDPIVGMRMTAPLGDSSHFSFMANVGGFGFGSDIAIQVRPMVSFGVSRSTTIDVGYQLFYMKYESGTGSDRFLYDVLTEGPLVGATFRF